MTLRAAVNKVIVPGAILVATKQASTKATRSGVRAIMEPETSPKAKK